MSASTNGTAATMPANASGARLATAPISRPPALPPSATSRSARRPALVDEVAGGGDEVGERVLLVQQLAVVVPVAAQLAAAADVRDGEDEARGRAATGAMTEKLGIHAGLVRAVAVDERRGGAVARGRPCGTTIETGTCVPSSAVAQLAVLLVVRRGRSRRGRAACLRRISSPVATGRSRRPRPGVTNEPYADAGSSGWSHSALAPTPHVNSSSSKSISSRRAERRRSAERIERTRCRARRRDGRTRRGAGRTTSTSSSRVVVAAGDDDAPCSSVRGVVDRDGDELEVEGAVVVQDRRSGPRRR